MKAKYITLLFFTILFSIIELKAQQDTGRIYFQQAFDEITSMLDGKQSLSYERAVFITENAYRGNSIQYADFKAALDIHENIIKQLIQVNDTHNWKDFRKVSMGLALDTDEQAKEKYRKALANWAIYTYLTDTVRVNVERLSYTHLPFTYSTNDPFGTTDWRNSQVLNLLETQTGNCYALVTLFKIFSERLNTDANIVTAPQHIYIEHRDAKGDLYNVELATRSFPGTGAIETLTYTTREAVLNNIALRSLDLKEAIGLNLVYLAKGYENKFQTKDDDFLLACADKTLAYDAKNLNAMLLKAQVYEQRVMKKEMSSVLYEKLLADLYTLGYRQMPDDMKNIIMAKIQGTQTPATVTNKTPNPFQSIGGQARYVTLSDGLFEELHTPQKIVRYGQTVFNREQGKIVKFLDKDTTSYQVDPVVFALSVDPLTSTYPMLTPYQFASNIPIAAVDLDGLESKFVIQWLSQPHGDGTRTVIKTETLIKPNLIHPKVFAAGLDGKVAVTETYYYDNNNSYLGTGYLYEAIDKENWPKPSAYYDYTKGANPEKGADDRAFAGVNPGLWALILARDSRAPDNKGIIEDIETLTATQVLPFKIVPYPKHLPSKKVSWEKQIEGTLSGPAKFKSGENVEEILKEGWNNGISSSKKANWRYYKFDRKIGANGGKETEYLRVEGTQIDGRWEVHGHPVDKQQYVDHTKNTKLD